MERQGQSKLGIASLLISILTVIGLFIIFFLDHSFLNFLNIQLTIKFQIYEYMIIQFFSVLIFFIFAKDVPPYDFFEFTEFLISNTFKTSSFSFGSIFFNSSILRSLSFLFFFSA